MVSADCTDIKRDDKQSGVHAIYSQTPVQKGSGEVQFYWKARIERAEKDGKIYSWLALMIFHNEGEELMINLHLWTENGSRHFPYSYLYQYDKKEDLAKKNLMVDDLDGKMIAVEQAWFLLPDNFDEKIKSETIKFLIMPSQIEGKPRPIEIDACYFKLIFAKTIFS